MPGWAAFFILFAPLEFLQLVYYPNKQAKTYYTDNYRLNRDPYLVHPVRGHLPWCSTTHVFSSLLPVFTKKTL